jgi:hypothetical protein
MPFCIDAGGDAQMGHCVACRDNGDCQAPTAVCDPTTHACGECDSVDNTACDKRKTGAICLASDTCGCNADGDCGSPDTGRVCSATTHACIAGCRGTNGNSCPRGMMCSSTDDTVGSCSDIPFDMSIPPVADMGQHPVRHDLGGGENIGLEGGGLSCAYGGGATGDRGAGVLVMLLGIAICVMRARRSRA